MPSPPALRRPPSSRKSSATPSCGRSTSVTPATDSQIIRATRCRLIMRRSPGLVHAQLTGDRSDLYVKRSGCRPCRRGLRRPSAPPAELQVERFVSVALCSRPLRFANDVLGVFVGPQAEIDRLAQFALAGPLRELHFRDQRRTHPGRDLLILHLGGERGLACLEPHELAVKLFENLVTEAGADVADVPPCVAFAYRQHEGAEEWPGSPRRREAGDHDLLPLRRLHLQPIGGPASGRVRAVGTLGHDAFEMSPLCFCEEFRSVAFAVVAERDQLVARQDGL